ncbi:MAG: nucleoside phosphorylase [Flavobacteriales bacterium]|nr:nucleoside phosphorylase [Flavobacteriales bacterium]MCZ2443380.1 nucleoside phosphorylase [Flavobacteriales bacterium]
MYYPESELILNERKAIYHLNLRHEELSDTVLLVGDPGRVEEVSRHFDRIEFKISHREFITHTGYIGKKRISCLSTGIGPDNIDIVLNELDALASINFDTRENLEKKRTLSLIRVGTTGSLQQDIDVDRFIVSAFAIGLDGLLNFYKYNKSNEQMNIIEDFTWQTNYPHILAKPYVFKSSTTLLKLFSKHTFQGITLTAPGFYAPQGRKLRYDLAYPDLINNYTKFRYKDYQITNLEMETSGLYGLSSILGHEACTICVAVANRVKQTFTTNSQKAVESLISYVLECLTSSHK